MRYTRCSLMTKTGTEPGAMIHAPVSSKFMSRSIE
ncbi:hypothetical protein XHC_0220 [Xanthomonas hortorum pv. carotae str. M081]|nr:hypothetical protein XHC_0220 [Xanthomonas hortorum pv. carotae str. M081]